DDSSCFANLGSQCFCQGRDCVQHGSTATFWTGWHGRFLQYLTTRETDHANGDFGAADIHPESSKRRVFQIRSASSGETVRQGTDVGGVAATTSTQVMDPFSTGRFSELVEFTA